MRGALHHVMARGIERTDIFFDDHDRRAFLKRLGSLADAQAIEVFAWALLPNHFHLLVRTGSQSLSRSMRRLLTGHAVLMNRRHDRVGHLFQNRYKSIVCEEEPYFLELVRYIHLNPLRAGVVRSVSALERYPFAGHSALLGIRNVPWQNCSAVLDRFGRDPSAAVRAYRRFVELGVASGRLSDLEGGGLLRSAGGWSAVRRLRRGREVFTADERVLGGSEFVRKLIEEDRPAPSPPIAGRVVLQHVIDAVCAALRIPSESIVGSGRRSQMCRAREGISYLWLERFGKTTVDLARRLQVHTSCISRAARRGRLHREMWDMLLVQCTQGSNVPTAPSVGQ